MNIYRGDPQRNRMSRLDNTRTLNTERLSALSKARGFDGSHKKALS